MDPDAEMSEDSRKQQCVPEVDHVEPPGWLHADVTKALVEELVTMVKKERGRILSAEEKYDIYYYKQNFDYAITR